jgi:hypothetical protein
MALAGGVFAGSHGAGDSGAFGHFCARSARFARAIDDSTFLRRWAASIPRLDDLWEQPDYANAAAAMWFYRLF